MNDLDRALNDLQHIRSTIVQSNEFRGFGDKMLFATSGFALGLGALQILAQPDFRQIVLQWILLGVLTLLFLGIEVLRRARFEHRGSAQSRMMNILDCYLPSLFLAAILTLAIFWRGEAYFWILPALWLGLIGVGTYSAAPKLPKGMRAIAFYYLISSIAALFLPHHALYFSGFLGLAIGLGQFASGWVHRERSSEIGE